MVTRRTFVAGAAAAATLAGARRACSVAFATTRVQLPWQEFPCGAVSLTADLEEQQRHETQSTLMALEEDSLLRPFRKLGGAAAPGPSLGGWYGAEGWAPGHCLGQWMSAMARECVISPQGSEAQRERLSRLVAGLMQLGPQLEVSFRSNPFPAYTYDKLLLGLMDAHTLAGTPGALAAMSAVTTAADPALPPHAMDRSEMCVKPPGAHDVPSCLDENYTLPENQFLAWRLTGEAQYLARAKRFLLDRAFFDRLANGDNALIHEHAYSHMNALSSGLSAYLNLGDAKYLRAVTNGFAFVQEQSYPTGGWGPEEEFIDPKTDRLAQDLAATHRGFETPCGSYAHFKLTRSLLRLTRDAKYGDSMERVLYNTVLGALPLETDGRAFYYSDYNLSANKGYFPDRWPCCGGTLPMVAADYRRNIYFASPGGGVVVNLYQESSLAWEPASGVRAVLSQSGDYPRGEEVSLSLRLTKPSRFVIALRVPAFANGAELRIRNERRQLAPGTFAYLTREWRDGDRIELTLPLPTRLEALDSRHPEYVALLRGPVVLFGAAPDPAPVRRQELLAAKQGKRAGSYEIATAAGPRELLPFPALDKAQPYSLFQRLG